MSYIPTAGLLARCCESAYAHPGEGSTHWRERLKLDLQEMRIIPLRVFDGEDVQGFVGLHYGHRITCFRGTDSRAEALTNGFFRRVDSHISQGSLVHAKFASDYRSARSLIGPLIDYRVPGQGVFSDWFTGHSRGGAIAAIMAANVFEEQRGTVREVDCGVAPVHLVTHSAPKAGNWEFANYLLEHIPHIRWQRGGDIVPLLPLPPMYWHDRSSHFFDCDDVYRSTATWLMRALGWPAAIRSAISSSADTGLITAALSRHAMVELRKLIEREELELNGGNLLSELLSCG